ncbi:MAG: peptidase M14 [Acidobacteria bacterium]|nr:MAG: peptidase M14 [Acidobacteriota bacterium]REK08390.1 MAG: peptidase M14 [Acidobacteriota bacterium]
MSPSPLRSLSTPALLLLAAAAVAASAVAQPQAPSETPVAVDWFWPGSTYDPAIPTFERVLGYRPAERIASHAELMAMFRALAEAAPERMRLFEYAESWQGRELVYAVIGSPANVARLDAIRAGMQALADPRATEPARAEELISELPTVVWLAYGVHGNEISSPDAAMLTAYHLLAAQDDPVVEEILAHAVVVVDPTQNPDGRDRFVANFRSSEGIEPDPDRLAAEHDEPWPGGRGNHYLFDLNRDWFALTQPETLGRVKALQEWYPQVFVDLHEMGGDSSYYFAPEAVPYNPHLAADQRGSLEIFGRGNATWFDRFGFDYFTREVYDAFYPGYGASWPAYFGAVAMTYEQASPRGLVLLRRDGRLLHFRDAVQHHFVASISTAQTAARHREKLLRDFWQYQRSAIDEGRSEAVRQIVLSPRGDDSAADKLAYLLTYQGVEVDRLDGASRICGRDFAAGSYVVDLAQPSKRLIRNLLDPEVPMEASFLEEQERRRARKLRDQIYDVTAWSLPKQFGVEATTCDAAPSGERSRVRSEETFHAVDPWTRPGRVADLTGGEAPVAYLVRWGSRSSARLLAAALRRGLVPISTDQPFVQGDRSYPGGSLVFTVADHPEHDLAALFARLATSTGAEVDVVATSWVDGGVNWGTGQAVRIRAPRVALAWDSPTSSLSAGAARYVLERQFGYPVTLVRAERLADPGLDLSRYNVLILPGSWGSYGRLFGDGARQNLERWVSRGGTLIAIESAIDLLTGEDGLLATERQTLEPEGEEAGVVLTSEEDLEAAITPDEQQPDSVAGVLLRAALDREHWLTAGLPDTVDVLYGGRAIYAPLELEDGVNVGRFAGPDELLSSGYLWSENRAALAYKPYLMLSEHGRGLVIAFVADPNQRAYLDGLNVLFLSAVFRGSAHTDPVRW